MPAQALILNADDLGLHPAVDRGILEAWRANSVSDTSAFATAPALPDLLARVRLAGMLPVGVHLNLTYGTPLSDPAEIPALVTPEGTFMKRGAWQRPLPAEQVRLELGRQIQRISDLGWRASHLDTHHHVHQYPEVLAAVIELALAWGLPVRATDDVVRARLRASGVRTPDGFSMAFYGEAATTETLMRLVGECPGGVLEIMTHPGHDAPDLPSSYRAERERELAALTDHAWHAYLAAQDVALIGYAGLMPG